MRALCLSSAGPELRELPDTLRPGEARRPPRGAPREAAGSKCLKILLDPKM